MIYTVTLNPSLDYIVCTDALRPGKLCRTSGETLHPGGKGVNVSLVCAALGLPTRALGFIAGRTGALFASLLAETGVEYDFCHLDEGMTRINVKVCAREQTELNGAGPQIPAEALERLAEILGTLGEGDWLVLSGSVPAGVPADIYAKLLERVRKNGVRTLLDTSGDALKNALPCAPDIIKPNLDELDALVGGAPHNPTGIAACARELQAAGAKYPDFLRCAGGGSGARRWTGAISGSNTGRSDAVGWFGRFHGRRLVVRTYTRAFRCGDVALCGGSRKCGGVFGLAAGSCGN